MKMVLEKKISSKEMKRYVMPKMAIKVIRQDLLLSMLKSKFFNAFFSFVLRKMDYGMRNRISDRFLPLL